MAEYILEPDWARGELYKTGYLTIAYAIVLHIGPLVQLVYLNTQTFMGEEISMIFLYYVKKMVRLT